ncbi:MAG: S8 family serine peptidase [Ignavibacteria bacterium]|nr:S8 family serine peptidase [Ignavibacteria bacterium]
MPKYPGSFNQVLTVGAVSNNGERESYSNYGNAIDLVAPGGIQEMFNL